jgi:hypothetical protein
VLGIADLALNVLNAYRKISRYGAKQMQKHKSALRCLVDMGIAIGKYLSASFSEAGSFSVC